jgi:hypothetical protein
MSLRRAQEATEVAREEFATVSQRVLREVDRFKREKAEDMRRTVLDYINLQVEYSKQMEMVWATLLPKLEGIQLDANSVAVTPETQQQMPQLQSHQPQYANVAPPPVAEPVPAPLGDPTTNISVQYRS